MTTPILLWGRTGIYQLMYSDKGSGADLNGSFYRPQVPQGGSILGDYGQGNYDAPYESTFYITSVENDDPNNPALAAPLTWQQIYNDSGSGADMDGSFWAPVVPSGYIGIGHISQAGYSLPNVPTYMCVRQDLVTQSVVPGPLIWNDRGSGADENVAIYAMGFLNVIYADPNFEYMAPTYSVPILVPPQN